ncbi:MAG: hypothetical protein KGO81_10775, partial [Bacteroidota bacterium]|nr:hypothetical protein [Bacteroidota bacterium]
FLLHKEYIDHDGIDFDEENEKPFSFYYPLFLPYREIKYLISSTFPKITWKESYDDGKAIDAASAHVITANGIILFFMTIENGNVYCPIHASVELTDFPFVELKRLSRRTDWFLYHINSQSYLNAEDDRQVEIDLLASL